MITLTDSAAVKVRQLLADEGAQDLALARCRAPGWMQRVLVRDVLRR